MKRRLEDLERYDKILFRLGLFLKGSLCAWPVARITNTGALAESQQSEKGQFADTTKSPTALVPSESRRRHFTIRMFSYYLLP